MGRRIFLLGTLAATLVAATPLSGSPAPSFTLQPGTQAVVRGSDVTFTAAANGANPMTFQWWFNGNILSGQTNTNIVILNVTATNSGIYWVAVTNSHGGVVSSNATLIVGYPPSILKHPVSQAAALNSNLQFSVTASGTSLLAYQWRFNGQVVAAATNASLAITNMQPARTGAYAVVVTNSYGAVTSDTASLTVAVPPEFLWARQATNMVNGYIGTADARHMAIDGSGNVFVVGYFNGWGLDFGGSMLTNNSLNATAGGYVCKYDQWGDFQWVRQFSTNSFQVLRVAADPAGSVYITGDYQGIATFGTNMLFSSNMRLMFVAKYDADGEGLWAQNIVASDPVPGGSGRAFTVDNVGNTFLVAAYQGTLWFQSTNSLSGTPAFMAKYDSGGNVVWLKGCQSANAVGVGASGAIYTCKGALTKFDSSGNQLWAKGIPNAQCITLDNAENIYLTGMGAGFYPDVTITNVAGLPDLFVLKWDSQGHLIWSRQFGGTTQQTGTGMAIDSFGNVYVASTSASARPEPSLMFGTTTLTNAINMLMAYDWSGSPVWIKPLGGTNRAPAVGLRLLDSGTAFVAGTFYSSASFDSFHLASEGQNYNEDIYLARLGIQPPIYPSVAPCVTSLKLAPGSQPQMQVSGAPGCKYAVEASTNMVDWIRLQTNVSPYPFIDTSSQNYHQRFYRAVWVR